MGGSLESKLVSLLQEKKLKEALELWIDNPELQKTINPNACIKSLNGDTPLHCAARYGSKPILWLLLSKGGDPFVRNAKGETPMHIVCTSSKHDSITNAVQSDLLEVLLTKIPEVTGDATYDILSCEEGDLDAKVEYEDNLNLGVVDKKSDTPLHMAAASGLITCVEILLAHGAPLHVRNAAGQTPCDVAVQAKQLIIAKLLESRMVLRHQSNSEVLLNDKKKEKIHASAAEALLQTYGWSEKDVVATWESDRAEACMTAGLAVSTAPAYVKTKSVTEHEDTIKSLVSEAMYTSYSRLKLQNFVACYKGTKYCPFGGCNTVVALPEEVTSSLQSEGPRQGVNVECSNGHRTCSLEPHEPCCCDLWEKWKSIVTSNEAPSVITDLEWLTKCTKSCPQCRIRIEKNEGCNHMTCIKCRHEFCWICLTPWSKHGEQTGGYFSCNRYKQKAKAEKLLKMEQDYLKNEIAAATRSILMHYRHRYENHLFSYAIELELAKTAAQKDKELTTMKMNLEKNVAKVAERMPTLQKDVGTIHIATGLKDISEDNFFEKVTAVLLNARQILAASYALGYFIPDSRAEDKEIYESLQSNLEGSVERLSQMVNRPYLCTPHSTMVVAARDVDCVCEMYLQAMKKQGLSSLLPSSSLLLTSIPAQDSQLLTPSPSPSPPSPSPPSLSPPSSPLSAYYYRSL
eukprot:Em0012g861a